MATPVIASIRNLPLHDEHVRLGGRMGTFGEWQVPLYFSTILEEHHAVRKQAGLFDISHMGEFLMHGTDAERVLNELVPRNISAVVPGKAAYSMLLNERGGVIDDIIIYKYSPVKFLIIVNAGHVQTDFEWMNAHLNGQVKLENLCADYGLLALQGPLAADVLAVALPNLAFASLPYYGFMDFDHGVIARTGYTGEDGFEIMVKKSHLRELWSRLIADKRVTPAGFGARDTLRLEAGMLLCGQDMTESHNPVEAGLSWTIDFNKPQFIGKAVIQDARQNLERKLIGFEMLERGIPRHGYSVMKNGAKIGEVTSGSLAPTLEKNIGLAYVQAKEALVGSAIEILVRDKPVCAKICTLPFYKRQRH